MTTPEQNDYRFLRLSVGLSGLMMAAGSIVCASTCLALLARAHWFCDLFTHFRVQYLVALFLVAACLLRRHKRWAAVFSVFAVFNLATIAPFFLGAMSGDEAARGKSICALLLNVNSQKGDVGKTLELIRRLEPDVVVLAEVNGEWARQLESLTEIYPGSVLRPRGDNFGIAVLSKLDMIDAAVVQTSPADVPSVIATLQAGDKQVSLIATHPLPPAGAVYSHARNEQLRDLARRTAKAEFPVLLLGDLNVTAWSPHFQDLLRNGSLQDSMHGYGIQPSWPTWMPIFFIPIDHCLYSDGIRILDRRLGPYVESDHLPVIVDFAVRESKVDNLTADPAHR